MCSRFYTTARARPAVWPLAMLTLPPPAFSSRLGRRPALARDKFAAPGLGAATACGQDHGQQQQDHPDFCHAKRLIQIAKTASLVQIAMGSHDRGAEISQGAVAAGQRPVERLFFPADA